MEMTDHGGIGNPAFEAAGDELDNRDNRSRDPVAKNVTPPDNSQPKEGPLKSCHSKVFKSAIGLVIFLAWAACMQVKKKDLEVIKFQPFSCFC